MKKMTRKDRIANIKTEASVVNEATQREIERHKEELAEQRSLKRGESGSSGQSHGRSVTSEIRIESPGFTTASLGNKWRVSGEQLHSGSVYGDSVYGDQRRDSVLNMGRGTNSSNLTIPQQVGAHNNRSMSTGDVFSHEAHLSRSVRAHHRPQNSIGSLAGYRPQSMSMPGSMSNLHHHPAALCHNKKFSMSYQSTSFPVLPGLHAPAPHNPHPVPIQTYQPAALPTSNTYHAKIRDIYAHFCPQKLPKLPRLLAESIGRERDLYLRLCQSYGIDPVANVETDASRLVREVCYSSFYDDTEDDDTVTWDDFRDYFCEDHHDFNEEDAAFVFEKLDTGRQGYLTRDQLNDFISNQRQQFARQEGV